MITWTLKAFDSLTAPLLFDVLRLRQQVFVVEQNCAYADIDHQDKTALHLIGWCSSNNDGPDSLGAYLRIMSLKDDAQVVSIGRVVVDASLRRLGVGSQLMGEAIRHIDDVALKAVINISAQQHLIGFYQRFGFVTVSEPYDEDGIIHVRMCRQPS